MEKEKLIVSLIKDDLINTKLVIGLNEIGLRADNYFLHLGDTILKLMGYEDNKKTEAVFERYVELSKKAKFIDISESHTSMDELAREIYRELSAKK